MSEKDWMNTDALRSQVAERDQRIKELEAALAASEAERDALKVVVEDESYIVERIREMGTESLSPDSFADLERVLAELGQVRRALLDGGGDGE